MAAQKWEKERENVPTPYVVAYGNRFEYEKYTMNNYFSCMRIQLINNNNNQKIYYSSFKMVNINIYESRSITNAANSTKYTK